MVKKANLMYLYAETSVHIGGGDSVGAIDLAVVREKFNGFPFIPSSGLKGSLRAWFEEAENKNGDENNIVNTLFGADQEKGQEGGGAMVFTDARLLLFPVRSLKGIFAWITCPYVLERWKRDHAMASKTVSFTIPQVADGKALIPKSSTCKMDKQVVLEEYVFDHDLLEDGIVSAFTNCYPSSEEYASFKNRLKTNLVVLSDNDFTDFVKHSTEVQTRIKLGDNKVVKDGSLFFQENVPCDAFFYSVIGAQKPFLKNGLNSSEEVYEAFREINKQRLQLGGNESIGMGQFFVELAKEKGDKK